MESLVEFGKKVIVNKSTFGETLVHVNFRCESDLQNVNTHAQLEPKVRLGQ